jgi:hypothetical protein
MDGREMKNPLNTTELKEAKRNLDLAISRIDGPSIMLPHTVMNPWAVWYANAALVHLENFMFDAEQAGIVMEEPQKCELS